RDHGCRNNSLKGAYGGSFSGSTPPAGTSIAVGLVTFDGKGGVAGSLTANVNGTVLRVDAEGTYAVECRLHRFHHVGRGARPAPDIPADGVPATGGAELLSTSTIPELVPSGIAKRL